MPPDDCAFLTQGLPVLSSSFFPLAARLPLAVFSPFIIILFIAHVIITWEELQAK